MDNPYGMSPTLGNTPNLGGVGPTHAPADDFRHNPSSGGASGSRWADGSSARPGVGGYPSAGTGTSNAATIAAMEAKYGGQQYLDQYGGGGGGGYGGGGYGGGGGGGGAGAAVAAMEALIAQQLSMTLAAIAESYDGLLSELNRRNREGEGWIKDATDVAAEKLAASRGDYSERMSKAFRDQKGDTSKTVQQIEGDSADLMADLQAQGASTTDLRAQVADHQALARNQGQLQTDLMSRLSEIAKQDQANAVDTNNLTRTSSLADLKNNYEGAVTQLQTQRSDQELQAQLAAIQQRMAMQGGMIGGGGGGGGGGRRGRRGGGGGGGAGSSPFLEFAAGMTGLPISVLAGAADEGYLDNLLTASMPDGDGNAYAGLDPSILAAEAERIMGGGSALPTDLLVAISGGGGGGGGAPAASISPRRGGDARGAAGRTGSANIRDILGW